MMGSWAGRQAVRLKWQVASGKSPVTKGGGRRADTSDMISRRRKKHGDRLSVAPLLSYEASQPIDVVTIMQRCKSDACLGRLG